MPRPQRIKMLTLTGDTKESEVEWELTAAVHFGRAATQLDPAEPEEVEFLTARQVGASTTPISFDEWCERFEDELDVDALEADALGIAWEQATRCA